MPAISERRIPVDRRLEPGLPRRPWIGDDVRGGERFAGKRLRWFRKSTGFPDGIVLEAIAARQLDGEDRVAFHALSFGTSSHFFCFQLLSPSSASCTPFAPSSKPQRQLPSPATCFRKSSHCALKALS